MAMSVCSLRGRVDWCRAAYIDRNSVASLSTTVVPCPTKIGRLPILFLIILSPRKRCSSRIRFSRS